MNEGTLTISTSTPGGDEWAKSMLRQFDLNLAKVAEQHMNEVLDRVHDEAAVNSRRVVEETIVRESKEVGVAFSNGQLDSLIDSIVEGRQVRVRVSCSGIDEDMEPIFAVSVTSERHC